jgi:hypothetical protein
VTDDVCHSQLTLELARERAADLRRAAEARAVLRPEHGQRLGETRPSVTLRLARPDDAQALAWLASLDSAPPLSDPVLLAEVGGAPRAAVSLSDLRVVADPFAPTEALVQLMMVRARQLQGVERASRPRLARLRALLRTRPMTSAAGRGP